MEKKTYSRLRDVRLRHGSSNVVIIESLGLMTCCVGTFSGWRRGDVVGKRSVEPGEDQRSFENGGQEPQSP